MVVADVTVGYERARGMRAAHQRPDGFSVGVTKTFPVGAERLHAMFAQARQRNRWIDKRTLALRTATTPRTARFDFGADGSRVVVGITAKGASKSPVTIQHERLPSAEAVTEMRAFWKERLAALPNCLGASALSSGRCPCTRWPNPPIP